MIATGDSMSQGSDTTVSFRQLNLFEAVGRLGSVTRAASDCGLTQPAATQALAVLARKVGFPLLDRGARGISLTPTGRELHARARLLIDKLDRGLRQIDVAHREDVIWRLSHAQLRLLEATHERGSLERAAIVTGIAPRAAKRALRTLETLLGCAILAREDGATVLTVSGATLARHIGLLADELEWTIRDVREGAAQAVRTVVIGVATDPGTASLNATIKAHTARHPDWCVEVIEAGQNDLLARLAIGEIDVVLGHILGDPGEGVAWEEIATITYRIVGRHGHPLADKRTVAIRDLAREAWVLGARASQRRAASDALFAGRPQPPCAVVTSAAPLMAHVLADSNCLGLMTDRELEARRDLVVAIPHDAPGTRARIGLATRTLWDPTPVHRDVIDLIREQFAA